MKQFPIKYLFRLVIVIVVILLFSSCTSFVKTKPNPPFAGNSYPSIINYLARKNPLIAQELGKLPELQDGVTSEEKKALENIAQIYTDDPDTFGKTFDQMYRVGLPEIRRYCSPLQAMFWLALDGKVQELRHQVNNYSLERLLDIAWDFGLPLPEKQLIEIIDNLKDGRKKKAYLLKKQFSDINTMRQLIAKDYSRNRNIFSTKAQEIIERSLKHDKRWGDFNGVVERLNAPELIDYYERKRFTYVFWWTIPGYRSGGDPYWVFKNNKGDCVYITSFTVCCLRKGGYEARELHVSSPSGLFPYHAVCLFEMNAKRYIMDNGRPDPRGIISFKEY
ncbi:MAG: hypothetical protein JRI96_17330 [Deltaproteobacteria bacterium]|nr:hypothetical protein [Deltaproteobacteria bacterium]